MYTYEVSWNGGYPKSSMLDHFNRINDLWKNHRFKIMTFHYKPSTFEYPHLWKPPYGQPPSHRLRPRPPGQAWRSCMASLSCFGRVPSGSTLSKTNQLSIVGVIIYILYIYYMYHIHSYISFQMACWTTGARGVALWPRIRWCDKHSGESNPSGFATAQRTGSEDPRLGMSSSEGFQSIVSVKYTKRSNISK